MFEQSGGTSHPACRVFISYAQQPDDPGHAESVERFWIFLRQNGIDAQLDRISTTQRLDWALWMGDQIRTADFVLIIASHAYRERAEGRSSPDDGRGVQWEARLIRDAFYGHPDRSDRFVPVVLPGESIDGVPDFLAPATSTVYYVSDFTVAGAEPLLRFLTGQHEVEEPDLGPIPVLAPRTLRPQPSAPKRTGEPRRRPDTSVHNEISGV
ncbi:MAG TPA: toll/interleukin-1 receptor domain-containing protein, partial [Pseudonocardiaceae bacterium]|nr:toll/interleukin-1 receptor domain-containing protein [Pseudonocardiaceae bacterium]